MARTELTTRARQAIETKRRIIRCAKKLVQQHGFDRVSVSQISEEAGITVGTFYYYFESKDDLLYELLPKASIPEISEGSDLHSYVQLIDLFRHLVKHPFHRSSDLWVLIMRSEAAVQAINKDRLPKIGRLFERGQKRGEFTKDFTAGHLAEVLIFTNRGLFVQYVQHPDSMNYPQTAMDVIERLAWSYLTEEGRREVPAEYRPIWA